MNIVQRQMLQRWVESGARMVNRKQRQLRFDFLMAKQCQNRRRRGYLLRCCQLDNHDLMEQRQLIGELLKKVARACRPRKLSEL